MAIPRFLKGYQLEFDGRGLAGKADITLPTLTLKTEDFAAGGMSGEIKIDTGLFGALDCKIKLYEYNPYIIRLWGQSNANAVALTAYGAEVNDSGAVDKIRVPMRGLLYELDPGSWEAGAKTEMECTINCRSLQLFRNGREELHLDAERMIRVVNGVDQMAAIRGAIGL